jgi:hypothetical protein
MADKKGLGLPQTKGEFKVRGIVTGMNRKNTFTSKKTKTDKLMNTLNFGVNTNKDSSVYVTLSEMVKNEVYVSKKSEEEGKKSETQKIAWDKRNGKLPDGFKLIGVSIGLEKDEKGKNIVQNMTAFDAAEKVFNNLKDSTPVFVRGNIDYSSYKSSGDVIKHNKKFNVGQLYLSGDINFEDKDFVETNDFKQKIIYTGIEIVDDKEDPHAIVKAKIVTYNSIEDTEFIVRKKELANQFKKNLKPYWAIDVWGKIFNKVDIDDTEESDVWGDADSFKNINKNYIRELVIVGAEPKSIDKETYSEKNLDEAVKAYKEFSGDNWGANTNTDEEDDSLPW